MQRSYGRFTTSALAALVAGGLATSAMAQTVIVAPSAPPAPRVETVPPPPMTEPQSMTWQPGHWAWAGNTWAWMDGHYVARPQPAARWEPGHWAQQASGGYVWVDGRWEG